MGGIFRPLPLTQYASDVAALIPPPWGATNVLPACPGAFPATKGSTNGVAAGLTAGALATVAGESCVDPVHSNSGVMEHGSPLGARVALGEPLEGVTVEIEKMKSISLWKPPESVIETQTIDSVFNLRLEDCRYVRLRFRREGYSDETIELTMAPPRRLSKEIAQGEKPEPVVFQDTEMKVVLSTL